MRIAGTPYPVLLPTVRDPRLHLAAVIVSLQVLGQTAFGFQLSIAQILVALLTCAVLEVAIAFGRQRVIMWPASALLTGNGVAFILRVPGTEHGDWWSLRGWWIFAGTAAVALLSKHAIRFRGRHVFNPSNIGLVLSFLLLGADRAEPLDFWWGPMSVWLALALGIIVAGGLAILLRLRLLGIAVGFWLAFAAGLAVLAAGGHAMTARWHLGPVTGEYLWLVLAFSPEVLVFLFFMITDPRTVPDGRRARLAYGVAVGLLATFLIAPQQTEYASKVALLGALALVCAARPLLILAGEAAPGRLRRASARAGGGLARRATLGTAALAAAAGFAGLLVLAGLPARTSGEVAGALAGPSGRLPAVSVAPSDGLAAPIDRRTSLQVARDVVAALRGEAEALRDRAPARAADGADGAWLATLWRGIGGAGGSYAVPAYEVERLTLTLRPGEGQAQPTVLATLRGKLALESYAGSPPRLESRGEPAPFERTVELGLKNGRYVIVRSRGGWTPPAATTAVAVGAASFAAVRLRDVAAQVGLRFRHGAFRFGVSTDETAMMGGGLCWLDYDRDGWLDLFVVNSYAEEDLPGYLRQGGVPRSALFRNRGGRFEDVSRRAGAALPLRGSGCVAADLDRDGDTDLYVTTAGYNAETDGYDALLWNDGDGTFTEGARAAGITAPGWHAGAAAGDVNADGRPDLFVAGYTDLNAPIAGSGAGFPTNHAAVRDRLYLNEGPGPNGRPTFREVAKPAGIEAGEVDHGLGALFTDVDGDGRLDLYVANDLDPNRLYVNVAVPGDPAGLGFRLEERGRAEGVDDANAGMGVAAGDFDLDGRSDLFVTNSRDQLHAVFRRRPSGPPSFEDARAGFAAALGASSTGWGVTWADLDLDGNLDLVLANGAIPVVDLERDAERVRVLRNLAGAGRPGSFADATSLVGLGRGATVNGRGLAAADYDNDGDLDLAVNSIGGPLLLLQATGARGHWLEVQLPSFAAGAEVTAVLPDGRTLVREVRAGGSYLSSEDPRVHLGLGEATRVAELRVRYPDGRETRLADVAADRLVTVAPPR